MNHVYKHQYGGRLLWPSLYKCKLKCSPLICIKRYFHQYLLCIWDYWEYGLSFPRHLNISVIHYGLLQGILSDKSWWRQFWNSSDFWISTDKQYPEVLCTFRHAKALKWILSQQNPQGGLVYIPSTPLTSFLLKSFSTVAGIIM